LLRIAGDQAIGGEGLAVIHGDDWRHIVRIPGLASLILDRVEIGGLAAVNQLLARREVGQALCVPEMSGEVQPTSQVKA
jgi:hypothetical protein